ncbi:MAG TPA: M28 family peptidase [Bacteroidales bacterium]|nr:M28 family peptidase [Bacteroidales bacterium]HOH21825.1 M28 family peptidase [Bacteroidales bacterium]HPB57157.1 M28 family peptidase [Bacteroidales bacterium]HPZ02721.1 M28 family peptidase [Bacteroidales bacterium]HQB74379.1 M28 family peptidase [Bacteroidales bacterium]
MKTLQWLPLFFMTLIIKGGSVQGQDSNYVKRIICDLSAPEMYGRAAPYNGEYLAAQYLRRELQQIQVDPLGNNYFQEYPIYGYEMIGNVSVVVDKIILKNFYEYRLPFHTPSIDGEYRVIQAPLEILDYTKEEDTYQLSEMAQIHWEQLQKKYKERLKSEVIYFNADRISDLPCDSLTKVRIRQNLNDWKHETTNIFEFSKIMIGMSELPGFGTRKMEEKEFSFFYVKPEKITPKTKKIRIHFENKMGYRTTQNVVGMIPGTTEPDSFVVLIGHYDHLGMLGDDCVFYGAHDNASGVAYVLSLGQYFVQNRLKYSVVLILSSGEESGLQGSTYFVEHPLVPLDQIIQVINFDLLCGGDEGLMMFNGVNPLCARFLDQMERINGTENWVPEIQRGRNAPNSDHYPFTLKKIPALFTLTIGGHKPIATHTPDDRCEFCGVNYSERILKLFIRTLETF